MWYTSSRGRVKVPRESKLGNLTIAELVVGLRFGDLTVVETNAGYRRNSMRLVGCICDCGKETVVGWSNLSSGGTKNCGCKRGRHPRVPGHRPPYSLVYGRWLAIRNRCTNPNHPAFKNYGGRGIGFCEEWQDFRAFETWCAENEWAKDLDIDRIDNSKGYSPENCRIVTRTTNNRNKRNNRRVVAFGETKLLCEWAEDRRCGVTSASIWSRLDLGWSPEDAITTPTHGRKKLICVLS